MILKKVIFLNRYPIVYWKLYFFSKKYKINLVHLRLILCTLCCFHIFDGKAQAKKQYAYVSTGSSLCQYRVINNGLLIPLTPNDVPQSFSAEILVINEPGHMLYALDGETPNITQYKIASNGTLHFVNVVKTKLIDVITAATFDARDQCLYLISTNGHMLRYHAEKSAILRLTGYFTDQKREWLFNINRDDESDALYVPSHTLGHDGTIQEYHIDKKGHIKHLGTLSDSHLDFTYCSIIDEKLRLLLVATGYNALVPFRINANGNISILHQNITELGRNKGLIESVALDNTGHYLFLGTYHNYDARVGPLPSGIISYHVDSNGRLQLLTFSAGIPIENPHPFADRTGHFLYVVGYQGQVDIYRIRKNGKLKFISRRGLAANTMAFAFASQDK